MKKKGKIVLISVIFLLTLPFIFDMLTVSSLRWFEIQRYGGINISPPLSTQDGYYLPILCDVSGTDSITIKPVALSSSNTIKRTKAKIKGLDIFISIKTSNTFFEEGLSKCKAVKLGKLGHGHYKVYYESGEIIGEFDL